MVIKNKKNALDKFFKKERIEDSKDKWLLFDAHNLMFRTVFTATRMDPLDKTFTSWKFLMINSIFRAVQQFQPNQVMFALDSRNYWRKKVYAEYKGHRKTDRKKSIVDFDAFFPVADQFWDELQEVLTNFHFMRIDTIEADDTIAVFTREISPKSKIINISTDHDMYQLMTNKNYQQYDPIKRKIVKCINPKVDLQMKILTGDRSDNIPAVAPRTGEATAKKILNAGLENFLINEEVKSNYERNKNLIDFDCIPEDIITMIKTSFNEQNITDYNGTAMYQFLVKNKILRVLEELQDVIPTIKKVGKGKE